MPVLTPVTPAYTGMPGSTISWPPGREFTPARMSWGAISSRSAWAAVYTGQTQRLTHLADRLRVSLELPPALEPQAGAREAYFMAASAAGNWIRLGHFLRPVPLGTLRGAPTVAVAAAAGARQITVNTTAGATLQAGDVLGFNGQLIQCGYGGAVADGGGTMLMPLVLPLRRALAATSALVWSAPTGAFQILSLDPTFAYSPGRVQAGLMVELAEVYA
jgi:hypothetical protein